MARSGTSVKATVPARLQPAKVSTPAPLPAKVLSSGVSTTIASSIPILTSDPVAAAVETPPAAPLQSVDAWLLEFQSFYADQWATDGNQSLGLQDTVAAIANVPANISGQNLTNYQQAAQIFLANPLTPAPGASGSVVNLGTSQTVINDTGVAAGAPSTAPALTAPGTSAIGTVTSLATASSPGLSAPVAIGPATPYVAADDPTDASSQIPLMGAPIITATAGSDGSVSTGSTIQPTETNVDVSGVGASSSSLMVGVVVVLIILYMVIE